MIWMVGVGATLAYAAEIRVPADAGTLDAALRAASEGDSILLDGGLHRLSGSDRPRPAVSIRGTGIDTVVELADDYLVVSRLSVETLSLRSSGPSVVALPDSDVVIVDVVLDQRTLLVPFFRGDHGSLTARNIRWAGAGGAAGLAEGTWWSVEVDGLTVSGGSFPNGVLNVRAPPGAGEAPSPSAPLALANWTISAARSGGAMVQASGFEVDLRGLALICSTMGGPGFSLSTSTRVSADGLVAWGNRYTRDASEIAVDTVGGFEGRNITLGVRTGTPFLRVLASGVELEDVLFAGVGASLTTAGWALSGIRRAPGTVGVPSSIPEVIPDFWGDQDPESCGDVWLLPKRGSALVDTGALGRRDRDGSRADIGGTGGPFGVRLIADDDFDRFPEPFDCDDHDPWAWPGAEDEWYDGVDSNCDGADDHDKDQDGFAKNASPADCDDEDPLVNPGAAEVWYDGRDQNCDAANDFDRDGDGVEGGRPAAPDCDDGSPDVYPGAPDRCYDGLDQDCDGWSDFDCDKDGFERGDGDDADCDDRDPSVRPGALEDVGSIDRNCDGQRDPSTRLVPASACTTLSPTASWLSPLLALLALRRRR